MRIGLRERSALLSVLALLIGLGLWMQLGLLSQENVSDATVQHLPDYFVKNFVGRGRDGSGTAYVLRGAYLQHFPDDSTVEIKQPCLLLFEHGASPRLVFADTGKVIENGTMIVLLGNVEILERLPANIDESLFVAQDSSLASCISADIPDGTWTRADEVVIQLKPGLKR